MVEKISGLIEREFRPDQMEKMTRHIAAIEKTFCYARFAESAHYCYEQMQAAGLRDLRLTELSADGETAYLDFIMPQAWDATDAELAIIESDGSATPLLDYRKMPLSLANRCAPTPQGGLIAEVITATQLHQANDATGKLVYTEGGHPSSLRAEAAAKGAIGLISDRLPAKDIAPDETYWINGWCGPGWYQSKQDPSLTCFSISPTMGKRMSERLAQGAVRVQARADTRLYDGAIYTVEGLIPGQSEREIVLLAHIYEPFPGDDAIGAAALIEIARTLTALIARGELPTPRLGIRFLIGMERYGFAEYWQRKEARQRAVLGISMDAIGLSPAMTKDAIEVRFSPASMPFWGDLLLWEMARKILAGYPLASAAGNLSDDTFFSDSTIGVPSQWVWTRVGHTHHSSLWFYEEANDWPLGAAIARLIAGYVADMATAGAKDVKRYCDVVHRGVAEDIQEAKVRWAEKVRAGQMSTAQAQRQARFLLEWEQGRIRSLGTMFPQSDVAQLEEQLITLGKAAFSDLADSVAASTDEPLSPTAEKAKEMILPRRSLGMPFSQARIPLAERMAGDYEQALNWADSNRSLYEIAVQTQCETGQIIDDAWLARFMDYCQLMARYGYLAITEAD